MGTKSYNSGIGSEINWLKIQMHSCLKARVCILHVSYFRKVNSIELGGVGRERGGGGGGENKGEA